MFALIVCRVIRCSLQYTREIKLGHAWWKELRSPTISQLPHNCEVGWEIWAHSRTWNAARQTIFPPLSLSPSLSPSFYLIFSPFAPNHVTQLPRNACYIKERLKTSTKEKNSKEWIAEATMEAVGVWFFYVCRKEKHGRELGISVTVTHKSGHIHAWLLNKCLYKLNQTETHSTEHQAGSPTCFLYIFFHAINKKTHWAVSLHFVGIKGVLKNPSFYECSNFPTEFPPFSVRLTQTH